MNRGYVQIADPGDLEVVQMPGVNWSVGAKTRVLSRDEETGAFTALVSIPAGYRREVGHLPVESEFFILDGSLRIGGSLHGFGYYDYAPANTTQERWICETGCEMLFMSRGGGADYVPEPGSAGVSGQIQVETESLIWTGNPVQDGPPAIAVKLMRHNLETGESVLLIGQSPRSAFDVLEYHPCIEEVFCIHGSLYMSSEINLHPGSYLWRPAWVSHGPTWAENKGFMALIYLGGPAIVDYHATDPRATPEENRLAAEALVAKNGPPADEFANWPRPEPKT